MPVVDGAAGEDDDIQVLGSGADVWAATGQVRRAAARMLPVQRTAVPQSHVH